MEETRAVRDLAGRVALVTGGAGGIGSAICSTLLRAGARVVVHDLPSSRGADLADAWCRDFGEHRATFVAGDLADLAALADTASSLVEAVGGFDCLVNNAAIDPEGPIASYALAEFLAVQTINAHAAFVLCQALVPAMRRKGAGAIVNVLSITLSGGWANKVPYVMSKGALLGLTRSLARELGPDGVRVNAVSPGAIPTAIEHKHYAAGRAVFDAKVIERQSLPFRADVQDVADAVHYLLSPGSRFITGQELHANGGWYMG